MATEFPISPDEDRFIDGIRMTEKGGRGGGYAPRRGTRSRGTP